MGRYRPIIKLESACIVICDNPFCDYSLPDSDIIKNGEKYLDVNCPKCSEPLLTEDDLRRFKTLIIWVKVINFLFSWVTLFIPSNAEPAEVEVHTHKKTTFKKKG